MALSVILTLYVFTICKVAVGAACLYVQQLERIERFSPPGNQQLAADMEYFCNVLAALSVALPTEFISWQVSLVRLLWLVCQHFRSFFTDGFVIVLIC